MKSLFLKLNEEDSEENVIPVNILDCWDLIEDLLKKEPDGRKREWKVWKERINSIIIHSNKIAGFKVYKMIK